MVIKFKSILFSDFARIMSGNIGKAQKRVSQRVSAIGVSLPPDLETLVEGDTPQSSPRKTLAQVTKKKEKNKKIFSILLM